MVRFDRYAFWMGSAIAILAGCGGGNTQLSPSAAAVTAEGTRPNVTEAVLWSFKGHPDDGTRPEASLINVKGTLYGTTWRGGSNYSGTVFSITPSGTETVLLSFEGDAYDSAASPLAGLLNVNGTLYGTTEHGGASNCGSTSGVQGCGTVFASTLAGAQTVLHRFGASGDGEYPEAGLINVKGTLYGTTPYGGPYGLSGGGGTVFAVTTSGKEVVLHGFGKGGDGAWPEAGLINVNETLYGTTSGGGAIGGSGSSGTVFAVTTSGKEMLLHTFGSPGDGAIPRAGLVNVNGTLYGTTFSGGTHNKGTVFAITTSGAETVLHSFRGYPDGAHPWAGLLNVNGTLYGTTYGGGAHHRGTVFAIPTSGKETVLYSFGYRPGGANPKAALIDVNGTLYGTTSRGGADGQGTVFSLTQ